MFQYSLPVLVWKWWSLEEDREKSWRKKPLNLLLQICGKSSLRVLEDFSIVMRTYPVNQHNLKERTAPSPRGRFHFLVIFRSALFQIYLSKNLPTDLDLVPSQQAALSWPDVIFQSVLTLLLNKFFTLQFWGEQPGTHQTPDHDKFNQCWTAVLAYLRASHPFHVGSSLAITLTRTAQENHEELDTSRI